MPSVHSALIAMPTPPLRLKVLCALVNAVVVACGVRNVFFPATPLPFIPDDDKARSSDYTGSHTTPSAWWTPFLKDFSSIRRLSAPAPRFQS